MRAPLSWLREMVAVPADQSGRDVAEVLIRAGLEVETVESVGAGVDGPLLVGRVLEIEELTEFKKPIRWCQVDVGPAGGGVRGVICGASNFVVGDLVVVALPGTVLPGGFEISARSTYGKVSDGMICSERELALGDDHAGIMVLPADAGTPGDDAAPVIGVGDEVLDIAVTPDRGYALSIRGIAREVAIGYGLPLDDPGLALADLPAPSADHVPAECGSDDLDACDLFTMRTIVGFDPGAPSPLWMQRRLVACGMRPVSLAVDVTNYVMLELGQPLHAFDLDKLRGPVRASRPDAGTTFETLDHVVRTLSDDDLVIRDDRGPIGLAGVMGGLETEIDDSTRNIALEAAHFSPVVVARASRRHKLSSEASRRFERGVDRDLAPYASARAAALLLEFGGGHYVGMTAVESPLTASAIRLPVTLPGEVAGMPIDASTADATLTAVGCEIAVDVQADGAVVLHVTPPSWRPDLTDPADLVEEVIRLVGYDELPSTLPVAPAGHGLTHGQRLRRRLGLALAARGGVEVLSYPFVGDVELDALRLPVDDARRTTIKLANPLSDEQPYLRGSLLPGLLAALSRNIGRGASDIRLFEMGQVFAGSIGSEAVRPSVEERPDAGHWQALNDLLPTQPLRLAVAIAGDRAPAGWWGSPQPATWADAIEQAHVAAEIAGVDLLVETGDDPMLHPGRAARLRLGAVEIGAAGELHPRVVEALGLPPRTSVMELDLDALAAASDDVRPAPSVSGHPVAKEDIALVVDEAIRASDVEAAVREGAGELLESVRLFDVYAGPQVGEGRKSLAFALRLRAPDRTLSAGEIAAARQGAIDAAATRCGAQLRA